MNIIPGVYETLVSTAIERKLTELPADKYFIKKVDIDSAESCKMLSDYLAEVVCDILKNYFREQNASQSISSQVEVVNKVLQFIESEWKNENVLTSDYQISEKSKLQFLRGIYKKVGYSPEQVEAQSKNHPFNGYRVSSLFTGGNDISIDDEIKHDIQTSNRIDFVVSFIKFEGVRLIYQELKDFLTRPDSDTKLRILTTTYMGATDPKAIRKLYELKELGDVEIRASFNNSQERLHAKAYIFYRDNGFDTAYIGSSNLSRTALTKGLEWNMRVTSVENAHIINKTKATFDSYWNSDDFEAIDSEEKLAAFEKSIWDHRHVGGQTDSDESQYVIRFERKVHQIKVLEKLQFERNNVHSFKNLIIAATGTGKTAISAFDFKDFSKAVQREKGRKARLLFVAHREKILKQARTTFRSVMVDANFGEIWSGRTSPGFRGNLDQLFITIQTLNNRWDEFDKLGKDYYDYIVIDEVHHSQAGSYREMFTRFDPEIFIGLTATPERMDGKEIKPDFNNRFAAEIRLQEALDQRLLSPFDYFCITDDSVDLSMVPCRGDTYDKTLLTSLYKAQNIQRFSLIQRALENYVVSPHECKAVCFCAGIEHAELMADMFNKTGYKAKSVTSHNSEDIDVVSGQLARGEINYLCVADILNEGIDIPEIDTVLFLRPTESLTVFLQQLGRGLRLADGKTCLTVLDFVAQANKSYNYERRFRALVGKSTRSISQEIKSGFKFLPRGCSITMERQAQEYILQNINDAIFNKRRLVQEVIGFEQNTGQTLSLRNFLDNFGLDIRTFYKPSIGSWTRLKQQAGVTVQSFDTDAKYTKLLEGSLARLYHTNSYEYLEFLQTVVSNGFKVGVNSKRDEKFMELFYYTVWLNPIDKVNNEYSKSFATIEDAIASLKEQPWIIEELQTLIDIRLSSLNKTTRWFEVADGAEIELYGCYSADEIHLLLEGKLGRWQVLGTQYNRDKKFAMVFVTLNKSDREYSPSTLYEDYAISQSQFHWQSMNRTRIASDEGQRIIKQRDNGWKYILFVRDSKTDEYGNTNGYYCLGPMDFNSSHGECPMNVVWDMHEPIPGFILESAKAI
jgi:superfamily II DNA or RNA helicase/HKD family nuclease